MNALEPGDAVALEDSEFEGDFEENEYEDEDESDTAYEEEGDEYEEDLDVDEDLPELTGALTSPNDSTVSSQKPRLMSSTPEEEAMLSELSKPLKNLENVERNDGRDLPSKVTDLQFRMLGERSQIQISFDHVPLYRQNRDSSLGQVVILLSNTKTPDQFQRAYDTTEFKSPVGVFSMIEEKNSSPSMSRLIIHMRENIIPKITAQKKSLLIEFGGSNFASSNPLVQSEDSLSATDNNIYTSEQKFSGKTIEKLEIKDSAIQDVLRLIAKSSGYNVVIGEDVTGNIGTMSLSNVPWDQAFTMVLQSKKLGYVKHGNVLRIATLDSLKAEKEAALANEESKIKVEPLHTVLIPISYADAAEMQERAKTFLTTRGTLDTDKRSNTVIIKDIHDVVERVKRVIAALDTQPPRVSISAKVVEMLSTLNQSLGISTLTTNASFSGTNINSTFGGADFGAISSTTLTAEGFANLNATLAIQELDSKVRVLANPVVSAVSNQEASVTQSVSFFITESQVVNGAATVSIREVTANLSMKVTPIVSGDGAVFMNIDITNQIPQGTGAATQIQSRNVTTEVLVENGDTAVIGGVFNSSVNMSHDGIPFLKHIPIIGFFTSQKSSIDTRNEILVFLTPKILNEQKAFRKTI